jgi:hypothetical protein
LIAQTLRHICQLGLFQKTLNQFADKPHASP